MMKQKLLIGSILLFSLFSCSDKTADAYYELDVTLSQDHFDLLVGEKAHLSYSVESADTVGLVLTMESMDNSIAWIEPDGTIVAQAPGQVNILVKSEYDVYAVCGVTVAEESVFNNMVGHYVCDEIAFLDNATGKLISEAECLKYDIFPSGQSPEWYEASIELEKQLYTYDLYKDSTMKMGVMFTDMTYRYVNGKLSAQSEQNLFKADFDVKGTNCDYPELYEIYFKYMDDKERVASILEVPEERFYVVRYFKVERFTY